MLKKLLSYLLKPFLLLKSFFSTELPKTEADFEAFYQDVIDLFKLPSGNQTRQAFATMIMHLPNDVASKSKAWFAVCLKKALANQAAYNVLDKIRQEEKKEKGQDGQQPSPPPPVQVN
jgi:hypothetical protein